MRALHLPGVQAGTEPPYSFPDKPAPPSVLRYTPTDFPLSRRSKPSYLIRVLATSLTRDELTWSETLDPSRFKPHGGAIPGHDVIGNVAEVLPAGRQDSKFSKGDRVWGFIDGDRDGAAAEYTIALEGEISLAPKCPGDMDDATWIQQLATLPLSALTAWQALFIHGGLVASKQSEMETKHVLILGAGAAALAMIPLAKHAGFVTIVVASERRRDALSDPDVSPDQLITTGSDFESIVDSFRERQVKPVDLILDTMGGDLVSALLLSPSLNAVVKPGRKFVTIANPISVFGEKAEKKINQNLDAARVSCQFFIVKPDGEQLQEIGRVVQARGLKGYVDSAWPLESGMEAMEKSRREEH